MAPTKEKAKKVSGDDGQLRTHRSDWGYCGIANATTRVLLAADMILDYLRKQNRPYSATDISANLHNKVTKTGAAKILKEMHEKKEIEGRAAGKQIVYHVIQDPADAATPEHLAALDAAILSLQEETTALRSQATGLKSTLSALNATLSTADLRAAVADLEAKHAEVTTRLDKLRKGDVRPISAEEKQLVEKEEKKWETVARKRKAIVKEMWTLVKDIATETGKNLEDLKEELGLTD
ncbi:TBPIP-like protein [Rhizodiscina lignyota]|uniref:TBPIP-like protein n=1 Tax=Rhizodiscina lignyota TaxID=1504668 RepID=A0A9P4M461_9PEZI|nr:TBPIP-like protein [Rhizodiscina lignyota]